MVPFAKSLSRVHSCFFLRGMCFWKQTQHKRNINAAAARYQVESQHALAHKAAARNMPEAHVPPPPLGSTVQTINENQIPYHAIVGSS